MEIELINKEKNLIELKIDNITVAELLRVYLNNNGIEFAAWKMEHPTKPVLFRIKSDKKTVSKAIVDAIKLIKKDLEEINLLLKKK